MKMMFKIIFTTAALGAALVAPSPRGGSEAHAAGGGVFFTEEEILHDFFPDADAIESRPVDLVPLRERLRKSLGYAPLGERYPVWVGRKAGAVLGYAVIDEEKGMHEPITFAVLIGPDGAVKRQEVMVYREVEGDGITRKAFRRQFIGKTAKSSLRTGVDVNIVSGATISSNSMAVGVRRALAVVTQAFLEPAAEQARVAATGAGR